MTWAIESQMDAAARALTIDPVEIRLLNLAGRGRRSCLAIDLPTGTGARR